MDTDSSKAREDKNLMNTPENWETFATIRAESERAAWWLETFGGDRCPVKSILPHWVSVPGHLNALVYEIDIRALTSEMRERLVQSIAKRFGQDPAFIEASLDDVGCPVLADDVVVSTTNVGLFLPDFEMVAAGDGYTPDPYDFDEEQDERDEEFYNQEIICETCGGVTGPEYSTCFCDDPEMEESE